MAEEKRTVRIPHNIIMENRETLNVSGVNEVDSFDEQTVSLFTELGGLTVEGEQLQIQKFSVETGELTVSGNISRLSYSDQLAKNQSFFGKLFK